MSENPSNPGDASGNSQEPRPNRYFAHRHPIGRAERHPVQRRASSAPRGPRGSAGGKPPR